MARSQNRQRQTKGLLCRVLGTHIFGIVQPDRLPKPFCSSRLGCDGVVEGRAEGLGGANAVEQLDMGFCTRSLADCRDVIGVVCVIGFLLLTRLPELSNMLVDSKERVADQQADIDAHHTQRRLGKIGFVALG